VAKILGTAFGDTIGTDRVTTGNDTISTGNGSDLIVASLGSDAINAGSALSSAYWRYGYNDYDTVNYGANVSIARIVANLQAGTVAKYGSNGALLGTDTLVGVDTIVGTAGNDSITGRERWGDSEEFRASQGNDVIDGRGGNDSVNYIDFARVNVNLATGTATKYLASGATAGTDTLRQVELIVGTNGVDTIDATGFGATSTNRNSEGDGFNLLSLQNGADVITGNGETVLNYGGAAGSLSLSLASQQALYGTKGAVVLGGTATTGAAGASGFGQTGLRASGVSGLRGGNYDDTLVGGGHVNTLGFAASSTVSGDASAERFRGNGGDDSINGGTGLDRAEYHSGTPMSEGITVQLASGIVTGDAIVVGTDTLRGIEVVTGTYLDDVYDARGFTLSSATTGRSLNYGDCIVNVPTGETLASLAFNEYRPTGGNDVVTGNGATRLNFASMGVEKLIGTTPSVIATFSSATAGTIAYGLTDGGLGTVQFSGVFGVQGGLANDSLTGGAGFQELRGYYGNDTLLGGDGNDRLFGYTGSTTVTTNPTTAYTDNDSLDGGAGNDLLRGDFGDDVLLGGLGLDTLEGGTGNDTLNGAAGQDMLTGGAGNDRFVFSALADTSTAAPDLITDFVSGVDRIDLSALDANATLAGDQAFTAVIASTASFTAAGQLKLVGGVLYGNTDANYSTSELAIRLTGVTSVTLGDFIA
jgi:Ca2+-binding RTX toxin-like protein